MNRNRLSRYSARGFRPASASRIAPASWSTSPLASGILPGNLRFPAEGGLAVALWDQWRAMLDDLRDLGRLLLITRNADAIIGVYGSYPELAFHGEEEPERFAHGGGFALDLAHWHYAHAREESHSNGSSYAIEILDARRNCLHKACLTAEADFPRFLEWVQVHQAALASFPLPIPPAAEEPASAPATAPIPPEVLPTLLRRLMEREMPIRVAVGNEAVSQSHAFTFREMREMGGWIFCSDGEAGWHLRPDGIADLVFDGCRCGRSPWLRALSPEGKTVFLLAAAPETDLREWDRMVSDTLHALG